MLFYKHEVAFFILPPHGRAASKYRVQNAKACIN